MWVVAAVPEWRETLVAGDVEGVNGAVLGTIGNGLG